MPTRTFNCSSRALNGCVLSAANQPPIIGWLLMSMHPLPFVVLATANPS